MRKRAVTIAVAVVLVILVATQGKFLLSFDWRAFAENVRDVRLTFVLGGAALIYAAYYFRALRWQIFIARIREVPVSRLISPTLVGFSAIALFGRAGELVRPYLIARRESVPFASQISVCAVERLFDTAAFALVAGVTLLVAPQLRG